MTNQANGKRKVQVVVDLGKKSENVSEAASDSSDEFSSDELEDVYASEEEEGEFTEVVSKKNRRNSKGMGPRIH